MKNIKNVIVIICLFSSSISIAQDKETDNREVNTFGLKVGLNHSNVYNSRTHEFTADPKFGFAGGMVLSFPINKYFGVQPEVLLSQKGFKGEGMLFGSKYNFTRTTTYIDVPLQIVFKPSEFLTILTGPQYAYLIEQRDVFTSSYINTIHEQEFNNENIRNNIFGYVIGVDVNIKRFILGTRLGWDISHNHGGGSTNTPRYKNRWFQVTIGYILFKYEP